MVDFEVVYQSIHALPAIEIDDTLEFSLGIAIEELEQRISQLNLGCRIPISWFGPVNGPRNSINLQNQNGGDLVCQKLSPKKELVFDWVASYANR